MQNLRKAHDYTKARLLRQAAHPYSQHLSTHYCLYSRNPHLRKWLRGIPLRSIWSTLKRSKHRPCLATSHANNAAQSKS